MCINLPWPETYIGKVGFLLIGGGSLPLSILKNVIGRWHFLDVERKVQLSYLQLIVVHKNILHHLYYHRAEHTDLILSHKQATMQVVRIRAPL